MEINLISFLSLFTLLLTTSLVFLLSKKVKHIPYPILLVLTGVLIGLVSFAPGVSLLTNFKLTPDLLFFVFLPILIFESAYNINLRSFYVSFASVSILSTFGLLLSTLIISLFITGISFLFGFHIPILATLLFGAIISATDPVAVLSIFKEIGVPHRLSLIFEGESLFNDGTAVALFLIILGVIEQGFYGFSTVATGLISFLVMIIGGILLGIFSGKIFSYLLKINRAHESNLLIIMFAMAHITFIATEFINHSIANLGYEISISPIISTTVASLILGNVGKLSLKSKTNEFFEKFWKHVAFAANSIVFILMGLMFVDLNFIQKELIIVTLISIIGVFVARIISVYFSVGIVNATKLEPKIPISWQGLLAWGDLKGALAIIVVLTLPDDLTISGWNLAVSLKELIISATIGVVVSSLIIKAPTIKWVANKLKLYVLSKCESVRISESKSFVNSLEIERLGKLHEKGYIDTHTYHLVVDKMKQKQSSLNLDASEEDKKKILLGIFKSYAIGIEQFYLQELYARSEIPEHTYRHIFAKLVIQSEIVESKYTDTEKGGRFGTMLMMERIDHYNRKLIRPATKNYSVKDKYLYYRCLAVISRKVLKELDPKYFPNYDKVAIDSVLAQYRTYLEENTRRMNMLQNENEEIIKELNLHLIKMSIEDFDEKAYSRLLKTNFITENIHN